jgi:hypothetical protein
MNIIPLCTCMFTRRNTCSSSEATHNDVLVKKSAEITGRSYRELIETIKIFSGNLEKPRSRHVRYHSEMVISDSRPCRQISCHIFNTSWKYCPTFLDLCTINLVFYVYLTHILCPIHHILLSNIK